MDFGSFKDEVLKVLNKFSARGTELNVTKTADIRLKIETFINAQLMDLASTTGRLPASKTYVHMPVCNDVSRDTSSIKQHLPGEDFSVELAGAKSYFLETTGPATITIDEETAEGVWTNLTTITVADTVTDFTEYKGLITAGDADNAIRINFSGDYLYSFRNYILYPYTFPSDATVQQHRPRFLYALPLDFLKMNNLIIRRDFRQEIFERNFTLDLVNDKLGIDRYVTGEYVLNYWRKPTPIVITGVDATDDAQTVDANDDAVYILALGVASLITAKTDPATSVMLNNLYEAKKAALSTSDGVYVQNPTPLSGW